MEWGSEGHTEPMMSRFDETEMWRVCRSLNSCRRFAVMMALSPTRVSSSWLVDAGELMDGFEFPDILQRWNMQRGSRQKAAWV